MLLNFTLDAFIPYALHFLPCGLCFVLQTLHALYFIVRSKYNDTREYWIFFFFLIIFGVRWWISDGFNLFLWKIVFNKRSDIVDLMWCILWYIRNLSNSREQSLYLYLDLLWNEENGTSKTTFVKGVPRKNRSLFKWSYFCWQDCYFIRAS